MTDLRRWILTAAALALTSRLVDAQTYLISTYAGGLASPTSIAASTYGLQNPNAVTTDRFGNTYISSTANCVFRLDSAGYLTRVAGTCQAGFSGDGGSATSAQLNSPEGVAVDYAGNLYIADQGNHRIRQVNPAGIINTYAGTGVPGYTGENVQATTAQLNSPLGIAVDPSGNLYIADQFNQRIRKVDTNGAITTIAGNGQTGTSGDGNAAILATLTLPNSVALDAAGDIYISDASSQIRKVNAGGTITHVAGTGVSGYSADSVPAVTAPLAKPSGLAVDAAGNLYIADQNNQRIRKIDGSGIITTYAGGNGIGSAGDNSAATSAQLVSPIGVAMDYGNNLYIADQSNRVRKVDAFGIITTAAGTGNPPFGGDGGPATLAQFSGNWGIFRDTAGDMFVSELKNDRVRKIAAAGTISTIAGNGTPSDTGDGGQAVNATVQPFVPAMDSLGNIYLADSGVVRRIAPDGSISRVAGIAGSPGYSGDDNPAVNAQLSSVIRGLAVDSSNNLYVSDTGNHRVRKIIPGANISTVAGTGVPGFNDDGPGTGAQLDLPAGLAISGNDLYIADFGNFRIRKLTSGNLTTAAGNGNSGTGTDGQLATSAPLSSPWSVAVDAGGNLYIGTNGNDVRKVSGGTMSTIAGTGVPGYSGDGGPAKNAQMPYTVSIATDPAGNVYLSDFVDGIIRVLVPTATESLLAITSTHTGVFKTGQPGLGYTITVSNSAQAAPTSGLASDPVTVTENLPATLSLVSMTGTNWNCTVNVCTRSDALAAGSSYDPISVVVSLAGGAPPQVTNLVTVSGGGSLGSSFADPTSVGSNTPVLQIALTHAGNFVAGQQGDIHDQRGEPGGRSRQRRRGDGN